MAQYNDRLMCIQGQNKNGGGYVNLDSLYEAQTNEQADALAQLQQQTTPEANVRFIKHSIDNFEEIVIYPNPASTFINISNYDEAGTFELYNELGQKVLNHSLKKGTITQKISLPEVSNGCYSYKIVGRNKTHFGKLNIQQNE